MTFNLKFELCEQCAKVTDWTTTACKPCRHNRRVIAAFHAATEPKLNGARRRAEVILATLEIDEEARRG